MKQEKDMNSLCIKKGDVFGSTNPMALGKGINAVQRFWSKDAESKYSHSGLICDNNCNTIESLWTVKSLDFYQAYNGDNVIIARYIGKPWHSIDDSIELIRTLHFGNIYPFWRIFMHIIPPLAKVGVFNRLVCSELCAKYLYYLGARHSQYKGTNPDTLADEWRKWKDFEVIFEGKLIKENEKN